MEQGRTRKLGKKYLIILLVSLIAFGCKKDEKPKVVIEEITEIVPPDIYEFGFNLKNYSVKRDTVRKGDSFGQILERNQLTYPKIFQIADKAKDSFDIRILQVGKPYTLLCSKDSLQQPKCFIYQPNKEDYMVVDFRDSITAYTRTKPIKYVEKELSGVITSNISETLEAKGKSVVLAYKMSDIYAWTIDFFRLQPNDRFKLIYTEKYIDDTIYSGIENIKAAYFEHNKEPFYAFEFETDTILGIRDYFSDEGKNLRRAFLKAPVSFSRISSRYNLKRRIAYYGNRIRPHKGTDFAAAGGSPIMATANGTVTASKYGRGAGNYVEIRHNSTYTTKYFHMSKRKAKVGDFVKQGEVIGYVGSTGSSSGNHVCYRFWKNGREVDPFKQKLPEAKPMSDSLIARYLEFSKPLKLQLDAIKYEDLPIKTDSIPVPIPIDPNNIVPELKQGTSIIKK